MSSLKVDEQTAELEGGVSEAQAGVAGRKRSRWWPRRKRCLLGLDIGSSRLKAVVLRRRQGAIVLDQAALAEVPKGAVKHGALTDGVRVSDEIRALAGDHHIKTRHVAAAVGGSQVYCQADSLSNGQADWRPQVESLAERIVPYSIGRAALDCQRLGADSDNSSSVLWVSAPMERVDWIRETIALAGKVPAVVDVEPCALANAWAYNYQPGPKDVSVLLHVGARRMTLALLRGETMLYSRGADLPTEWPSGEAGGLPERVMAVVDRQWETLTAKAQPLALDTLYLSGGAARSPGLTDTVRSRAGLRVVEMNPFRRISYEPASKAGEAVADHGPALAVAVGLALRSFDDL